jgi:enoyl-CoA hydratase/carnithine racemase
MAGESMVNEYRPATHVRQLVLDDPATRNALSLEMRAALVAALRAAAADRDCRVVILTGAGSSFASGSDIRMLAEAGPTDVGRPEVREIWDVLTHFPKPLVVAINGHALGGGLELALCGDILLAVRGARLGTPEPKLGIMPGGGATQRLVRAVGIYRAMRLLMTAEPIDAGIAAEWGIVTELCAPAELMPRALAVAESVARLPPRALAAIKEVMREGSGLPLNAALALEKEAFLRVFATADKQEGMVAFLEKRAPRFAGE